MKLRRIFTLLLVLVLVLAGCSEAIDDSAIRADAQVLLESFVANDYDTCRAILDDSVSDAELEGIFGAIHAELADLGGYEMTAVAWNRKISDGQDVTAIQYLIEAEGGKYYLDVSKLAGQEALAGFQISAAAQDAEPTSPTGPAHWVFTAIGAAVMIFVIWMIVDCARRQMKRKWLWLPLILLATVILTLTMRSGNVSFNFNIGLYLGMTNLTTFARGGFKLMIYVPLGAIVYFFKRKDLTIQPAPEVLPAEEVYAEGEEKAE